MTQMKKNIPGVMLCLAVTIPAWFLGEALPVIGSPVFGILFGMLVVFVFPNLLKGNHGGIEFGVKYTSKKLLQYSIILLGFGMNLFQVLKVGGQSLYVIVFTLSASFLTAFFMGKILSHTTNALDIRREYDMMK